MLYNTHTAVFPFWIVAAAATATGEFKLDLDAAADNEDARESSLALFPH